MAVASFTLAMHITAAVEGGEFLKPGVRGLKIFSCILVSHENITVWRKILMNFQQFVNFFRTKILHLATYPVMNLICDDPARNKIILIL